MLKIKTLGKLAVRHREAMTALETEDGPQSEAWRYINDLLEVIGKIIYTCGFDNLKLTSKRG